MTKALSIVGSSRSNGEREKDDFYPTPSYAVDELLKREVFNGNIWECACGEGWLSKEIEKYGVLSKSTDLIDRGYGVGGFDFLSEENRDWSGDIITNPPYKYAKQFIEKSLDIIPKGNKIAMFLKLTFLESKGRKQMFIDNPPKTLYVSSSRIKCYKNGEQSETSSAIAYGWYVWEKGFKGNTTIKWIN